MITHFQLQNARNGFPCYDEPALKTTFRLKITHDPHYTAISNMPGLRIAPLNTDGTVTTLFQPTPPISTYAIAFAVTDYANISKISNDNPKVNQVFAPPEEIHQSKIILDTAIKALGVLTSYIGIPLAISKMDHFVIPIYPGATENLGLNGYG